jgi:hypothetical protein
LNRRIAASLMALTGLAGLAGLGALSGCGEDKPLGFSSEAYCEAIAKPAVQLDAKAMIDGDEKALADAKTLYESLKALGPPSLSDEWALILSELDSMIKAAGGAIPVEDVDYQAFTDAFTTIEMDKHDRCAQ